MRTWVERHPNLTTWAVLAVGMVVVLAWSARDVQLAPSQRAWLGVATVLLAGLCAWIISWEADDEIEDEVGPGSGDGRADGSADEPVATPGRAESGGGPSGD